MWPALELAGCRPVGPRPGVNLLQAGQFLPLAEALGASQSCCQPAGELGKILEHLAEGHRVSWIWSQPESEQVQGPTGPGASTGLLMSGLSPGPASCLASGFSGLMCTIRCWC